MNVTHTVKRDVFGFSFMKKLLGSPEKKSSGAEDMLHGKTIQRPMYMERDCLNVLY